MDEKNNGVDSVGDIACFYIPKSKMYLVKDLCHNFFLEHYDAYTFEDSNIQGFWRMNKNNPIFEDINVKYVVSFQGEMGVFVNFLKMICSLINERCIYLIFGHKAWLVWPDNHE